MRGTYDVTIDGASVADTYGLILTNDTDLGYPEPKAYTVDIPGGSGSIDLTEALTGDVSYDTYTMTLVFKTDDAGDVPSLRRRLISALHGRRLPFSLGFDPGYTYTGRFSVSVVPLGMAGAKVTMSVTTDPYKSKGTQAYRLNATGGRMYRFENGRRPVHPTIECGQPCYVTWAGEETLVPAGTYVLRDVVFHEGLNELYVNTCKLYLEAWADVGEGGGDAMTWAQAADTRWDALQLLGVTDGTAVRSWDDAEARWADYAEGGADPHMWRDLDWRHGAVADTTAYLTYEWEDL